MEIYQHFREEERPFIDQVLSWQSDVEMRFERKESDFLNPREQQIVRAIMGNDPNLKWELYGGPNDPERKRAIIAPEYEEIADQDFSVVLLEATYPGKFVALEHRDVLGAFMSLGIRREKLGDLIVQDGVIQIVVASEISDYIRMNFTGVKKANVTFQEKPLPSLMKSKEVWQTKDSTLSSLRLDVLVKEIYGVSRKKAGMYVEAGHVKVNFKTVENPSFLLETGDLLSVRGKGRSRLDQINGMTKKEKYRVTTSKLN
ncbi:YlmH family RNA-binding protein [Halobacillus amylolyticus]|uniref:RNA-binding protein n=1 Tax=Halobacillus amylolyticus TaxID=2932259 RepID=A0ABY4HDD6_9BACI|nr:RNA-binding protein [Halobacillus amylolyticus]UOR12911.1 RNA-binding protein [Halobacillus amylolyticus]